MARELHNDMAPVAEIVTIAPAGGAARSFIYAASGHIAPDTLHLALASNRGYRLATFDARLKESAAIRGVPAAALG